MVKEASQPKAVNIIRPTGNNNYSLSLSSSGSTASNGSQQLRRTSSNHSSTVSSTNRKPRVVSSTLDKPVLNLYHPPTRKPSYDNSIARSRPPIELYKPQQQQQRLTKSFTAPSLSLNEQPHKNTYSRPISPSYFRPQQQQTAHHRSVLGVINTPAINSSADNITDKASISSSESIESSDQEIDDENDTSDKDNDDQQQQEEEDDDEEEEEEEDEEDDVVNEARVNRKIADLELSINSLLTVNAMLESTVRKQASQLSQIKKQQLSGEPINDVLVHQHIQEESTNEQSDDEEDWENDEAFQRLKKLTEFMIEEGQKSIDFEYKILGRVLSNYEEQESSTKDSSIESIPIKKQKSIPRSSPLAKK